MKKHLIVVVLFIFLASTLVFFFLVYPHRNDDIAAIVNGETIYKNEIYTALKATNSETLTYDIILHNSINELLVIQSAPKLGVELSDSALNKFLNDYENDAPEFFQKGVDLYGREQYLAGLARQWKYKAVKDYVVSNILPSPIVTDDEIDEYAKSINIDNLTREERISVITILKNEKLESSFYNWVALLHSAEIDK